MPFNVNDMDEIRSELNASIQLVSDECIFSCNDVLKVVDKLKLHKSDGSKGLSSDYFKKLVMISMCMPHFCCQAY